MDISIIADLITSALRVYKAAGGTKVDLDKLWSEADAEVDRIDSQQGKDEAAENDAAKANG